jgi:broad specificity phosphatase PhoE
MAIVRIARHGETTWNAVGRYQGRIDAPLSSLGEAQAQALAAHLAGKEVRRIISSPLSRCVRTALPLSIIIGVPVETDERLTEIAHGTWEGRYREEIARTEPELYKQWRESPDLVRFEGGESLRDVCERWESFVDSFDAVNDALIVTHDIVVRVAILERTGRPLDELRTMRALNCAYAEFETGGSGWALRSACVSEFLRDLAADHERQAL